MTEYNSAVPTRNYERIIFPSKALAIEVLDGLYEDCDLFMRTSMARFKMYCRIGDVSAEDGKIGWDKSALDKFEIKGVKSGFEIIFPTPTLIVPLPAYCD